MPKACLAYSARIAFAQREVHSCHKKSKIFSSVFTCILNIYLYSHPLANDTPPPNDTLL